MLVHLVLHFGLDLFDAALHQCQVLFEFALEPLLGLFVGVDDLLLDLAVDGL